MLHKKKNTKKGKETVTTEEPKVNRPFQQLLQGVKPDHYFEFKPTKKDNTCIVMFINGKEIWGTPKIAKALDLAMLTRPQLMQEAVDKIKTGYVEIYNGGPLTDIQRLAILDFDKARAKKMNLVYLLGLDKQGTMSYIRDFITKNYPKDLQKEALDIYEQEITKKADMLVSEILLQGNHKAGIFLYKNACKLLLDTVRPRICVFKETAEKANPYITGWTADEIDASNEMVKEVNAKKGKDEQPAVMLYMKRLQNLFKKAPEIKPFIEEFFEITLGELTHKEKATLLGVCLSSLHKNLTLKTTIETKINYFIIIYFFDELKNPVTNKSPKTINIKGKINALILLNKSHKIIKTIHKILQTFSAVSAFCHRPQISQATSLLFSHTFQAVSFRESFASPIFFSKSVFFSFFSAILNNIML